MEKLDKIEKESNFILPLIYKNFYKKCEISTPKGFVGTDLFNEYDELNIWALELINEDGTENFLTDTDFVFMMHQGYMFWYFNANGEINPHVYFYEEGMLFPKKIDFLDRFLVNYPK